MEKNDVKNILVIGKSGAGKQPRIDVLTEHFGFKQLSTGVLFRALFEQDTPLSKEIKGYINDGKWVPDKLTNDVFSTEFDRHNFQGCVLDGYPRTIEQAKLLLQLMQEKDSKIDFVLVVHREDEDIVNHAIHRRICPECSTTHHMHDLPPREGNLCINCDTQVLHREDDKEEKLKSRLNEYHEKVEPILDYLKEQGIPVLTVNGFLNPYSKEKVRETVMEQLRRVVE